VAASEFKGAGSVIRTVIGAFEGRTMSETIAGIKILDSKMAKDLTELIRDKEPVLLYHHSRRVYLFGALTGQRKGLPYDPELLYVGAMFHDIGLTEEYRDSMLRFEVDGANAARDFLRKYGVPESSVGMVWDAIALHTTPGIPEHRKAVVALVTAGVEMDVLGFAYKKFDEQLRLGVVAAHPRANQFKQDIIDAFYHGMAHRPDSTFGTVTTTCWHSKIGNSNAPISARSS
jgi:HD domain